MLTNLLTRTTTTKFRIDEKRRLTWYAAVFNVPTMITERDNSGKIITYEEVISPHAFDVSLARGDNVVANINHDDGSIFARTSDGTLLIQSDPFGLFCSAYITDDNILNQIEQENGASFQFLPVKSRTVNGIVEREQV